MNRLSACSFLLAGTLLCVLSSGCAGSHHGSPVAGVAPGLANNDTPLRSRNVSDPNAQYAVLETKPRLLQRPVSVDAAHAAPCDESVLSVSEIAANVNGNYRAVKLAFANRGGAPCKLGGYPGVALVDGTGQPVGQIGIERVARQTIQAKLAQPGAPAAPLQAAVSEAEVVLMPEAVAAFQVAWRTGAGCPQVSGIEVTAPESPSASPSRSQHIFAIHHPLAVCAGAIEISALNLDNGNI